MYRKTPYVITKKQAIVSDYDSIRLYFYRNPYDDEDVILYKPEDGTVYYDIYRFIGETYNRFELTDEKTFIVRNDPLGLDIKLYRVERDPRKPTRSKKDQDVNPPLFEDDPDYNIPDEFD